MIKKIIRSLIPPIIYKFLSYIKKLKKYDQNKLFDGNDDLFKNSFSQDDIYGEYGCGQSTIWVSRKFNITIYSVESDRFWKKKISNKVKKENCIIYYANIGIVGDWGKPINYERESYFCNYTDWIWQQKHKPSVILIDGRFRVCSFLTSLIHAKAGSKILFDDYNDRQQYHYIEKYIKPIKKNKRQSLFIVPEKKDLQIEKIKKSIEKFRYVFD